MKQHICLPKRKKPVLPDTRSRFEKIADRCILVGGVFIFFNYAFYFLKLLAYSEGLLPLIVSVAVMVLLGGYYLLRGKLKGKFRLTVKTVLALGLAVYTVSFVVMCGSIFIMRTAHSVTAETAKNNAVVWVFGAKINDMTPGKTLKKRLDTALELLKADNHTICIVSGGQGADEPTAEGEVMAAYLNEYGIDESRILIDDVAKDTVGNIVQSSALTEENNLSDRHIICVSTSFHLPRIRAIMNSKGIDADYCSAPASDPFTLYACLVREYMSWVKYILLGH